MLEYEKPANFDNSKSAMNLELITKIWRQLGDSESKLIFMKRLMYSITGDVEPLHDIIRCSELGKQFMEQLDAAKAAGKEIVIYGAGGVGLAIYETFPDYIKCFVDRNWRKILIDGVDVLEPDWLKSQKNVYVIIGFGSSLRGIENTDIVEEYLRSIGFSDSQIIKYAYFQRTYDEDTYFDLDALRWCDGDVFLDCGSHDFATSLRFIDYHQIKSTGHLEIVAFEPSSGNAEKIKCEVLPMLHPMVNAEIIPAAVWGKKCKLNINLAGDESVYILDRNYISEIPQVQVDAVTIDETMSDRRCNFIKMDIEGAEFEALTGARDTIKRKKPQLAISIYHKPEDVVDLPSLLLSLNPNYSFYLRHYSCDKSETVLYAINEQQNTEKQQGSVNDHI
jgi:FkbM family methyltransferase